MSNGSLALEVVYVLVFLGVLGWAYKRLDNKIDWVLLLLTKKAKNP